MFGNIASNYFLMIIPPVGAEGAALGAGGVVGGGGGVTTGTTHEYAGESTDSSPVFRTAFAVK